MYCAEVLFCVYDEPGTDLCLHKNRYLAMYTIELLSEMVYKVYETGGRQSAGSAWNEAARSDI